MCGHPGSFGHGVDGLQNVCHQVVWMGATYNLEHWIQVIKRVHRDGQQRPVIVTRLLARGTLEESVAQVVLPGKREVSNALLQAVRLRVSASNFS
jgi:RNA-splicing ligase RtcB